MAADVDQRTHVGFRRPLPFPVKKSQKSIPVGEDNHLQHVNQLQFNIHTPYSINSLASNFQKPQPLVIEKVPVKASTVTEVPSITPIHQVSLPSSPASSISSDRMHFAVQLAKMDAKKLKEHREMEQYEQNLKEVKWNVTPSQNRQRSNILVKTKPIKSHAANKFQNKGQNNRDVRRNLHEFHFYPDSERYPDQDPAGSDDKQTREIRRLEKQMHKYLERLDELIQRGQEVIQKKDKRLQRSHKDDVSHLSDEDTDPRQFKRAEEQAARSARVLYMIERQIRELDDELCRKGKNMRQTKKSHTLSRLAAAQRATVRALQMLINSAPLQPKRSQHYPSIYQELTSIIHQLSLLSSQLDSRSGPISPSKKPQYTKFDDSLNKPHQDKSNGLKKATKFQSLKEGTKSTKQPAFTQVLAKELPGHLSLKRGAHVKEINPDDSALMIEPTPERSATLKAGLEALLRTKELDQKPSNHSSAPMKVKKKAVLLPSSLHTKGKRAHLTVQKSVKHHDRAAHFTKETASSRLKKVERQKPSSKDEIQGKIKSDPGTSNTIETGGTSPRSIRRNRVGLDEKLQEKEIQRQIWLENEAKRKLTEAMEIPKHLVSEVEEEIKLKLKPLLDQAQAVVESSKTKPKIQERFADLASEVTVKENEKLAEMILDDILTDTAQELQRLEDNDDGEIQATYLQNSSTLENILQRLEQFEKEEESIRRHLNHVSYIDVGETGTRPRSNVRQSEQRKSPERENAEVVEATRKPCPIVIESKSLTLDEGPAIKEKGEAQLLRFTKDESGNFGTKDYKGPTSSMKSKPNYTRTSTLAESLDKPPVLVFLPSKVRDNIFSYRDKYSRYLKQTETQHHGTFDPWKVVERLSDEIFDEILEEVAVEFGGACDDVTELIFKSEFMKEES